MSFLLCFCSNWLSFCVSPWYGYRYRCNPSPPVRPENFHRNIFQLQLFCFTSQPLVAFADILLLSVDLNLLLFIIFCHTHILFPPSHILSTCAFSRAAGEDFSAKIGADLEMWRLSRCTSTHQPLVFQHCLHFMTAGSHILTLKSAWLWYVSPQQQNAVSTPGKKSYTRNANMERQEQKCAHIDTQANPHTVKRVHTDISARAQIHILPLWLHTHHSLLFYQVTVL